MSPSSSSLLEIQDGEVPETCLQKLTNLAEEHFKAAFETDVDRVNLFKVFRYFGVAYHSNSSAGEYSTKDYIITLQYIIIHNNTIYAV